MLLRNLYPGYTFLEKLCFLPLSRLHNPEEFYYLLENGLEAAVEHEFLPLSRLDFETVIERKPNLEAVHVEFYHQDNTYRICSENIEGVDYDLCIVVHNGSITWAFLSRTNE